MSGKQAKQGLHEAHTRAAQPGGTARGREPGGDLVEAEAPGDLGVFEPAPDVALPLPIDAREIGDTGRRARGRPKGSVNKSTSDMRRFLMAQGFRDPMQALASAYSMDTLDLAERLTRMRAELRKRTMGSETSPNVIPLDVVDPKEVFQLQLQAAKEAMPYWHAKRASEDAPPPNVTPVMVIGEFNGQMQVNQGAMSAGEEPKTVRLHAEQSHDDANDIDP